MPSPRYQAENRGRTMQRLLPCALAGVLVLAVVSLGTAQQVPQPVVRLGDWLDLGNDVLMHVIAVGAVQYRTVKNYDFEHRIRDRVPGRTPGGESTIGGESDISWARLDFGAEFRYQQNLRLHLLFRHVQIFDGNLIDDRSNQSNPGGTDIFGRGAARRPKTPASASSATGSTIRSRARRSGCAWGQTSGGRIRPAWWGTTTHALPSLGSLETWT